ncbi:MAG: RagB/SusD family nutrient uptake outer membrane protein [Muribaculaceae bacterium]|nr:RagB/SusD family nutrient uptake outer membrane protein [Muribaculaceae bacterium]
MKLLKFMILAAMGVSFASCHDLDLTPLSQGSSESWYSNENEIRMSVNNFYKIDFWGQDGDDNHDWSDDGMRRQEPSEIERGVLNGQSGIVSTLWNNQYKLIARTNTVLESVDRAIENGANPAKINQYIGETKFARAVAYFKLVSRFGDVPLILTNINIEEGLTKGRTPKADVIKQIYQDFDDAIELLPTTTSGEVRATKGAAMAYKARASLYLGDFSVAAKAAKDCMDLGVYSLHPDFGEFFHASTRKSPERIFAIPRSIELDQYVGSYLAQNVLPRTRGGWMAKCPSWALLASFTCTDGLPVDESPLFDCHDPFKNRDPRLSETIIPFGSVFLGVVFDPNPYTTQVMNYNTGSMVSNTDSHGVAEYASFNSLGWKKGVDESWTQNGYKTENDLIDMRYADVLLMYAEAKIELNEIDQSVIDAMNEVRARAYGVDKSDTDNYPEFTILPQAKMRTQLRVERRMEFANENRRFSDIMRWRIADQVYTNEYAHPRDVAKQKKNVDDDNWFWPCNPEIDENGIPTFEHMAATGCVDLMSKRNWDDRQYLWPIPTNEVLINKNMKQNPGY